MADFINLDTFEIIRSAHTPDFINDPDYGNLNHKAYPQTTLPACDKKYWKRDGSKIIEMTVIEKEQVDATYQEPVKTGTIQDLFLKIDELQKKVDKLSAKGGI